MCNCKVGKTDASATIYMLPRPERKCYDDENHIESEREWCLMFAKVENHTF